MADEKPPETPEEQPDDSEERFWAKFDERSEAAFDRYLAKVSAEIDQEEETEKQRVSFEARKKPAKEKEAPKDGPTADDEETPVEPTEAERRRAAGGVGPGQPSGYWERWGHRIVYGNRRRR